MAYVPGVQHVMAAMGFDYNQVGSDDDDADPDDIGGVRNEAVQSTASANSGTVAYEVACTKNRVIIANETITTAST